MEEQSLFEVYPTIEGTESPRFELEFAPSILSEACPYQVEVKKVRISELLHTLGVDTNSMKKLKLRFIEKPIISPDDRSTGAVYMNNTITISTGTWWASLEKHLSSLGNLVNGQAIGNQPSDSVKAKAKELLILEIQKKFDHDLIHETAHFAGDVISHTQAINPLKSLNPRGVGRFLVLRASLFGPSGVAAEEVRAEKATQDVESRGKWSNLIVVSKKELRVQV